MKEMWRPPGAASNACAQRGKESGGGASEHAWILAGSAHGSLGGHRQVMIMQSSVDQTLPR
jgi:hypothetical protein